MNAYASPKKDRRLRRHMETLESIRYWVQHNIKEEFLEFNNFCPDSAARFPPPIGIKT